MRLRVAIVALLLLVVAGFAFGNGQGESDAIKTGVAGAHSGDLASYGLPTVHAAQLVVDVYNENGGVNGQMVELIIADDQCDSGIAANAAAKLVSDGVVAVIGHICSGATNSAPSELPFFTTKATTARVLRTTRWQFSRIRALKSFFTRVSPSVPLTIQRSSTVSMQRTQMS
jgi:ABC-type branched-subunit amino acid transport system substrate-binding protein